MKKLCLMKSKTRLLLLIVSFFAATLPAFSQKTINGTITDQQTGETLPGTSVIVKGTTVGTVTDFDGKYSIKVPENGNTLVISFVGYDTKEVAVGDKSTINIQLSQSTEDIEEIMVIGYGVQKKSDKTGAVTRVEADDLSGGVLTDPIQSIQGKASGVMITKKGGDPSAGFSVKIRGASGFGSGTEPLYVIDGVPGVDPTTVAPEDIESFNVLKDASATAIYGSRGANGVIIITTKKGKELQESKIKVNSYVSFDNVANRLDLLSGDQVRNYVNEYDIDFTDGGANTDWQDEIYRQGISQSYNISASGGSDKSTYYASGTHSEFEGVVKGTQKSRTTGRLNLTQDALNDKLSIVTNLAGTFENNDYIHYDGWGLHDVLYQAFRRSPTDPVTLEDGSYHESDRMFNSKNPVATINEIQNERSAKRFLGNLKADLEIIPGLVLGTNFGYIRNDHESFYFLPTYSYKAGDGSGSRSYENYENKLAEITLSYNNTFNDTHTFNLVGGYSYQEENWDGFNASGQRPASNYVMSHNLSLLQTVTAGNIGSYKSMAKLISFFARGVYNYKSKYYLTATIRRDGSSKFGDNNEWGMFPSFSLAWNVKQESFLQNLDFISMLKLRTGYGITGNQDIGTYLDKTIMVSAGTAIDPETGETVISFEGDKNANPDLQWEENKEFNLGLDFGFFNDKISGSLEYYNKTTDHLLARYQVGPPKYKYKEIWANEGKIRNKGIELQFQAYIVDNSKINWHTSATFSTNRQEVLSLDGGSYNITEIKEGWVSGPGMVGGENWSQKLAPGYELGTFYMPHYMGLSQDGYFLFSTEAGGVTRDITNAERIVAGSALPDFEIGWSNQIEFLSNFELNFTFRAILGYDMLNATRLIFANPNGLMPNGNILQEGLDEKARGLASSPAISDYYLEDASFVRLDNITLAYNLNASRIKYVSNVRLYVTSNNLLTITGYSGLDPEITYQGVSFGIDQYNVYPKTRTLTFGINLSF